MTLRPAAVDTGIVFHRTDLARPVDHSRRTRRTSGDTRLSSTLKVDGAQRLDGRAPDVGACRPRHRQPARRRRRARSCRSWTAARARSCSCCSRPASRSRRRRSAIFASTSPVEVQRRRQVGALHAVRRLPARLHDRFPASGVRFGEPQRRRRLRAATRTSRRSRARARSASCRTWRRCAPRAWGSAAACRTRSCSTSSRVLNSEGLRYDNEFVRHKVLDAIGDLYLLGHPLIGQYTAYKSGPRAQQRAGRARCSRAPTPSRSSTFDGRDDGSVGVPRLGAEARLTARLDSQPRRVPRADSACADRPPAAVPLARDDRRRRAALLFTRDRRYLRFIVQVVKFTLFLLVGVLLFFLLERLARSWRPS